MSDAAQLIGIARFVIAAFAGAIFFAGMMDIYWYYQIGSQQAATGEFPVNAIAQMVFGLLGVAMPFWLSLER